VEIGDTIDMEETGDEEGSARSAKATGAAPNRMGAIAANEKRRAKRGMATVPPNGRGPRSRCARPRWQNSDLDLRRILSAMRDLRDGDLDVRLPMSEDPLLAELSDAFNAVAKMNDDSAMR